MTVMPSVWFAGSTRSFPISRFGPCHRGYQMRAAIAKPPLPDFIAGAQTALAQRNSRLGEPATNH
jgi:hypothetical protein